MKRIRVSLTALLVGAFMFLAPSPAFAEQAFAEVTCAKGDGAEQTFAIGWDNSNSFFEGKGDIPRLYCEGGYSQPYNFYVSDNLPADSPLRWYNGVAPEPVESVEPELEPTPEIVEPSPEPIPSVEPEPVPSIEPNLEPEPTPVPEPIQSESPSLEPMPEPAPSPEPSVTSSPEPTPTPTPTVSQVAPEPAVEPSPTASDLAPDLVPTPEPVVEPEPVQESVQESVQVVALEVPSALASIPGITAVFESVEAFMNIGSDMTDEQREESQSVVVAAVIVGQLAMRKTK